MTRIKQQGRYQYQCPSCHEWIKAGGGSRCRNCICDILFGVPIGTTKSISRHINNRKREVICRFTTA